MSGARVNVGSLFSGIGGMDLGLARAGFRHAFFCESDPWRRSVLAHHWPGVPIYEDVREVAEGSQPGRLREVGGSGADEYALAEGRIGSIDSGGVRSEPEGRTAGTGLGGRESEWRGNAPDELHLLCGGFPCQDVSVAGRRRGLAGERSGLFHEFARIAESLRPQWLLVENVPGLLSSNGGRDFGVVLGTLADIGYGLGWRIVDSRFFGVPQRRRRVFIVGALADGDPRGAAERAGEVLAVGTRCSGHPATRWEAGSPSADALRRGVVSTLQSKKQGWRVDAEGAAGGQLISHSLTTSQERLGDGSQETFVTAQGVRRLTPRECERLQSLPDDWTAHGADSKRYAALGDAVTANVAEWIGRRLWTLSRVGDAG